MGDGLGDGTVLFCFIFFYFGNKIIRLKTLYLLDFYKAAGKII